MVVQFTPLVVLCCTHHWINGLWNTRSYSSLTVPASVPYCSYIPRFSDPRVLYTIRLFRLRKIYTVRVRVTAILIFIDCPGILRQTSTRHGKFAVVLVFLTQPLDGRVPRSEFTIS